MSDIQMPTRTPVQSKLLQGIAYHPESQTLEVQFGDGPIYRYSEVSQEKYDALMKAESVGSHFLKHIRRGGHAHTRIDEA